MAVCYFFGGYEWLMLIVNVGKFAWFGLYMAMIAIHVDTRFLWVRILVMKGGMSLSPI